MKHMLEIRQTTIYADWFARLRDRQASVRIDISIRRLSLGNPGKVDAVGEGVSELKLDFGPGYRIYFAQRGTTIVFLLRAAIKRVKQKTFN
jgi:putative addiction module killer protein